MSELNQNPSATVPDQPEAKPPVRKGMRPGRHHRAHRHRQPVEPVAWQQKGSAPERLAHAPCNREPATGDEL
jgi:hypothetical protein